MSKLPMQKKILLGTFALSMVMVPIVFGALSGRAVAQDRDLVPLVRIQPDYPAEGLASGREGTVIVEFTVTVTGTTKDVVVVEASEPAFAAPAVAAVQKWRYQPQLVDGKAVERRGARTMIRFQPGDRDEP